MGPFDVAELLRAYEVEDRSVPHLRANFVSSLDGAATHAGLSGGLNNEADKQVFDLLRRLSDVIMVGAGTVRIEGYGAMRLPDYAAAWRLERGLAPQPVFALVSRSLALDPGSPVFTDAPVRPLVLTHAGAPPDRRRALAEVADVVTCGTEKVEPLALRAALVDRGLPQILCEGGPQLFGAFIEADAVDELCLTLSPVLEGGNAWRISRDGAERQRPMRLASILRADGTLLLRYLRRYR
ncbi:MAG TPA: pyrimidine reductase family protein [Actinomycetaceae bacterium]|nr:pyrimidine reductase family protein [Actinomycetaceae bacterium]